MNNEIKEILKIEVDCDYKKLSVDEISILEDYITNLQEELKSAYESIAWWNNRYNALRKENQDLKEQLENKIDLYEDTISYQLGYDKGSEDYKSRNEKALKFVSNLISEADCFYNYDILESKKQELEDILKGGDE